MKAHIKSYLSITKKEWNGLVVLVVLIVLILAAPYIYQFFRKDNTINSKDFDKAIALLSRMRQQTGYLDGNQMSDEKILHPVMFPFDPNNLSPAEWEQLGLSERQANVIKHYEAKGGKFHNKEDVKKINSITDSDYKRLEPFINIPQAEYASKKIKTGETIELNNADSAKLTEIRGVGPSFALRIFRYRERLGGYCYKEQLKEVYGIDSTKYVEIKDQVSVNSALISKISINTVSFNQLRIFPYLGYNQVNAIIQYRVQHGRYNSIADMKNIALLDKVILRKIEPYLNFE
ncbi:MAG TPA: helix-hairpin-helix domain-containing protein [Mucilaginibacter sp.]|jgi:DNA uptake protein ComE-like DNA-binding protein